ncbi:phosphohydrolase [Oceanisphaera marina]|uniref:Phosphohydrolase n=2 Tax=Oceanisphaera marina TaxID=2017550 RepID=A0ABQ1IF21_9GAMM|nr:phosphohydrolase [Oceanisphaera marina]
MTAKVIARKHVPDLKSLQRTCDVNYMALMKLLPQGALVGESVSVGISDQVLFVLRVLEVAPYTWHVSIEQCTPRLPSFMRMKVKVRLYHDVRMAEVCASQQILTLRSSYHYPNAKMHHRNEKEQVNLFLAEWLKCCLQHGFSTVKQL